MPQSQYFTITEIKGIGNGDANPNCLSNLVVGDDGLSLVPSATCQEAVHCNEMGEAGVTLAPKQWECMLGCDQKGYASFTNAEGTCWVCNRKDSDCCGDENGDPNCRTGTITKQCDNQTIQPFDKDCAHHIPAVGIYQSPTKFYLDSASEGCDCVSSVDCCQFNPTYQDDTVQPGDQEPYRPVDDNGVTCIVEGAPQAPVRFRENHKWVGQWVYYVDTPQGRFAVCRKPYARETVLGSDCPIFAPNPNSVVEVAQTLSDITLTNPNYDETLTDGSCFSKEEWQLKVPSNFQIDYNITVDAGIPEGSCYSAELYIGLAKCSNILDDSGEETYKQQVDSIEWQLVDVALPGDGPHSINGWPALSTTLTNNDLAIYPAFSDLSALHNGVLYSSFCCCAEKQVGNIIPAWEYEECTGDVCMVTAPDGQVYDVRDFVIGPEGIARAGGITPEEFVTTSDCMTLLYGQPNTDGYGGLNMGYQRIVMSDRLPNSTCITGFAPIPNNEQGIYGGLMVFGDQDTAVVTGNPYDDSGDFAVIQYPSIGGMDKGTKPAQIGSSVFTVWNGEVYLYANTQSQNVSKDVYGPSDPFTEIVSEPFTKSIVARTKNGRILRYDFETQSWSEVALCEGVDPCNLHLLSSTDCYGTRYYDDSTGKMYVNTSPNDPPITGEITGEDCKEEKEKDERECECDNDQLPAYGFDNLVVGPPDREVSFKSITLNVEGSCDLKAILCEFDISDCKADKSVIEGCIGKEELIVGSTTVEAKRIGKGRIKFDLPKGSIGTDISFKIKFCGDVTDMKIKQGVIIEYKLRGRIK